MVQGKYTANPSLCQLTNLNLRLSMLMLNSIQVQAQRETRNEQICESSTHYLLDS